MTRAVHVIITLFLSSIEAATIIPTGNNYIGLLVAQHNSVEFINLTTMDKSTLLQDLTSPISIDYDPRDDCIFRAADRTHHITAHCHGRSSRTLLEEQGIIRCIAYDWTSTLLYYVSETHSMIGAISTGSPRGFHRTIVRMDGSAWPMGLAVHPRQGYLFWTDRSPKEPFIGRSNLDGSDIRQLIKSPDLYFPETVTVDYKSDQIYWIDSGLMGIYRSNSDGLAVERVFSIPETMPTPFAVAVNDKSVFWSDRSTNKVYELQRDCLDPLVPINILKMRLGKFGVIHENDEIADIKLIDKSIIVDETNACNQNAHKCSHICVGAPYGAFSCLCPDSMYLNDKNECASHSLLKSVIKRIEWTNSD